MKKSAFKTLSILLAAVLLVVALPITAFAEDVSPCAPPVCKHNYEISYYFTHIPEADSHHIVVVYESWECVWCGDAFTYESAYEEGHDFGDEIDPEVDMSGVCIICGREVYW